MSRDPFRIIFMGTPEFAVPSLEALIQGPDELVAVVTQPDRPKGRSRQLIPPPVKILAQQHQIDCHQPAAIRSEEFISVLNDYGPDIIVVAAYGKILPEAILTLPRHGCINVHGSLLPRHRGAAPIQWSIIKGDPEVGVTIMQMDKGMDTGDILMKSALVPAADETAGSLFEKIARLGSQALMDTIDMIGQGGLAMMQQDDALATSAPMLKKEDGLIDWQKTAAEVDCLIRGLDPWPTAYCFLEGRKLQLFKPEVVYQSTSRRPGTLLRADREGLLIATGGSCLLIREIKAEGKRRMSVADFLNGWPLEAGCNLGLEQQRP
jgi:methionyl-tRNA formyltransferase